MWKQLLREKIKERNWEGKKLRLLRKLMSWESEKLLEIFAANSEW